MKICVLAISTDGRYFNIAGLDDAGNWVRAISDTVTSPSWDMDHLSFDQGFGFIRMGDVIEFQEGKSHNMMKPWQTEDYIAIDGDITLVRRLDNNDIIWLLEACAETEEEFLNTVNKQGRSICVAKVDFMKYNVLEHPGELPIPKMALTNQNFHMLHPDTQASNFTVLDTKWRRLILDEIVDNGKVYSHLYVVISMEETAPKHVEPVIVGIHTYPNITVANTYPD